MIYGSLVKINPRVTETTLWEQDNPQQNRSIDSELDITPIKELQYNNVISAMRSFSEFIAKIITVSQKERYGLLIRHNKDLRSTRECNLTQYIDGTLSTRYIINPLWSGHNGAMRNTTTQGMNFSITPALQSQMFALLEGSTSDSKWMQQFKLKDKQQEDMYDWQAAHFPSKNSMNTWDMINLMKNVLNVARLPWITLEFVNNSKACAFSISEEGGKVIVAGGGNEAPREGWEWLQNTSEDNFEIVGELDKSPRIKISGMKLTMALEWAMTPQLLLHEIAHYIAFCLPTPYRLNRGEKKMSFLEYEGVFSGHGALYMAIFSKLLIDFMYIKREPLYRSIQESGLECFEIKSLKPQDVNDAISIYLNT